MDDALVFWRPQNHLQLRSDESVVITYCGLAIPRAFADYPDDFPRTYIRAENVNWEHSQICRKCARAYGERGTED